MTTPFAKPHVPHRCNARSKSMRLGKGDIKRPYTLKPSTRAWKHEALLDAVREYVVTRRKAGENLITAEEVAGVLRAKKGDVTGCFVKLVAEGLVGRKQRRAPHDGCWWPSVYFLPRVSNNRVDDKA